MVSSVVGQQTSIDPAEYIERDRARILTLEGRRHGYVVVWAGPRFADNIRSRAPAQFCQCSKRESIWQRHAGSAQSPPSCPAAETFWQLLSDAHSRTDTCTTHAGTFSAQARPQGCNKGHLRPRPLAIAHRIKLRRGRAKANDICIPFGATPAYVCAARAGPPLEATDSGRSVSARCEEWRGRRTYVLNSVDAQRIAWGQSHAASPCLRDRKGVQRRQPTGSLAGVGGGALRWRETFLRPPTGFETPQLTGGAAPSCTSFSLEFCSRGRSSCASTAPSSLPSSAQLPALPVAGAAAVGREARAAHRETAPGARCRSRSANVSVLQGYEPVTGLIPRRPSPMLSRP